MVTIMQGDSYRIPIKLAVNGMPLPVGEIEDLEFYIGKLRKTFKENSVTYDENKQTYSILITQQETFNLSGISKITIRVKFNSGDVVGKNIGYIKAETGPSREVL